MHEMWLLSHVPACSEIRLEITVRHKFGHDKERHFNRNNANQTKDVRMFERMQNQRFDQKRFVNRSVGGIEADLFGQSRFNGHFFGVDVCCQLKCPGTHVLLSFELCQEDFAVVPFAEHPCSSEARPGDLQRVDLFIKLLRGINGREQLS